MNCKITISEYVPSYYANVISRASSPNIISDVSCNVGNSSNNELECLNWSCIALKPGKTSVKVVWYCNFAIANEQGYCSYCWQYVRINNDYNWYKSEDNFDITVTANYVLNYEANGEGGTGMPDSVVEEGISEDVYDITVSSNRPERKGFEFLGWSENPDDEEVMYIPENKVTLNWESGDTVNKTLYAVWRPEKQGGVVIYSWSGLPDNAGIELPENFMYNFDEEVEVDSREAGNIVAINGIEYKFSGWSSDELIINENKFKMPEGNVIITGYWTKQLQEVNIKAQKIWDDDNNKTGKRPDTVILQIYGNGNLVEEKKVSESENWSFEVELPKHNELDEEIVYTVDEKETSKFYEKKISGYTVINKFVVPDEKVVVKAQKIWDDDNNKLGKRPDSVTLQVKFGNEIIAEKVVNESCNWRYDFEVPKYDELGKELVYIVDEKETISDYIKEINGNIITNRLMYELPNTSDVNIFMYCLIFVVAIIVIVVTIIIINKHKK